MKERSEFPIEIDSQGRGILPPEVVSRYGLRRGTKIYAAFRERVRAFDFSPCAICGGCEMGEGNEEDCFGNEFPTCGGCLWAQGVVQCP